MSLTETLKPKEKFVEELTVLCIDGDKVTGLINDEQMDDFPVTCSLKEMKENLGLRDACIPAGTNIKVTQYLDGTKKAEVIN